MAPRSSKFEDKLCGGRRGVEKLYLHPPQPLNINNGDFLNGTATSGRPWRHEVGGCVLSDASWQALSVGK